MSKLALFEILFDNEKSVYNPSEPVTGKCVLDLKGDIKMKSLRIAMQGVAKVYWTESRNDGNNSTTDTYSAEIEYFQARQILFGSAMGDGTVVLTEGRHEFNFYFQLPSGEIPTSFEGEYGKIRYWLKAEIDRPWRFNHKTQKAFTVIYPIDINYNEYLVPVENNMEKTLCCWCCASGPISINARTDRKGYCPGQSISITADFENLSDSSIIPHAILLQTQTFFAGGKAKTRDKKYNTMVGVTIQPRSTSSWDAQLLIPAVAPSIINCPIMRVDYFVRISLSVGSIRKIDMDLPVIIGTVPLRSINYGNAPSVSEKTNLPSHDKGSAVSDAGSSYDPAPHYKELDMMPPSAPPPTYAECVEGSVNIADGDDGNFVGDTLYTPLYVYVRS